MTSPKGESKNPQSCVYKDGECKVVEAHEVEDHLNDGWHDNPSEKMSELQTFRKEKAAREAGEDVNQSDSDSEEDNSEGGQEVDASGTVFDPQKNYVDKRKDEDGNWKVKKNA